MVTSKNDVEVEKGIFKVAKPFRINRDEWVNDEANGGYAVMCTNYSEDYNECDVVYYTEYAYGRISDLAIELNEKEHAEKYGYCYCLYPGRYAVEGTGGLLVRIPD